MHCLVHTARQHGLAPLLADCGIDLPNKLGWMYMYD